jgi:hypothetical protein
VSVESTITGGPWTATCAGITTSGTSWHQIAGERRERCRALRRPVPVSASGLIRPRGLANASPTPTPPPIPPRRPHRLRIRSPRRLPLRIRSPRRRRPQLRARHRRSSKVSTSVTGRAPSIGCSSPPVASGLPI